VQVLEALRLAHRRLPLAGHALAVDVDGAAGEVVQRAAIRPHREAQVPVAELVEHPAPLRRERREALEHLDLGRLRV